MLGRVPQVLEHFFVSAWENIVSAWQKYFLAAETRRFSR
jgi:hypothetical protein